MAQVIIVSNRLPISVKKENGQLQFYPSPGGLAIGLSSYVQDRRNIWVGWPGIASDELTEADKDAITTELARHNCAPVFLTRRQLDDFYSGFSNSILWPLCHNLRVPKSDNYARWWRAYRQVNEHFTEVVLNLSRVDSTIWVHDYQLLLVPAMLRAERAGGHIGFFMHIPFPDPKTWRKLPEGKKVIEGILGADLVGFHTAGYVADFLDTCTELKIGRVSEGQVVFQERLVRVTHFPMGIDYEKYAAAGKSRAVKEAVKRYKRKYRGYKLIATVDRLDPSKGLVERLNAYRTFLEQNPGFSGKVILSMVAAPSRTDVVAYQNLKKRLDNLVLEINDRFGTPRWQPVDYIAGLPFEEVTALFRVADVAFIAPLRDGMNLVAKEFVASKRGGNGVLILSETAGAAQELRDALLVDPKQPATVVDALQQALTMPRRELRQRLKRMQQHLANNTVQTWANSFMKTLNQPVPGARSRTLGLEKSTNNLVASYGQARKRLLLLDYDGTLVPFTEDYKDAEPPASLRQLLIKLSADPANDLVLISGRSRADLDKWFGGMQLSLVAEHGAFIKRLGRKTWHAQTSHTATEWKRTIRPILELYTSKTPRAVIEEKSRSLVWHYRQSPPYYAQKYAVIIKRALSPLLKTYGLQLFSGSKILEIKEAQLNKGIAVKQWLDASYDFIVAIGDDYTDEDTFSVLPPGAWTIKVGPGRSSARLRAHSCQEINGLLERLVR